MEEYRKRARERHDYIKKEETEKKIKDEWKSIQYDTLVSLGYDEQQIMALSEDSYSQCINWKQKEWQGLNLPFCFKVNYDEYTIGYHLTDLMLTMSIHKYSAAQMQEMLGWSPEIWSRAIEKWKLVNPYPLHSITEWIKYNITIDECDITETVTDQLYNNTNGRMDMYGCGYVRIPPAMMRIIQEQVSNIHWSSEGNHPFMVVQIAYTHNNEQHTDFVVVQFNENTLSDSNNICLSPSIRERTRLKTGNYAFCRFVSLDLIRDASVGIGVLLIHCPLDINKDCKDEPLQEQLQQSLERQYILITNQWISIIDNNDRIWIYRVKTLWGKCGHPVQVANTYGAHIKIQIETNNNYTDLKNLLNNWFL